MFYQLEQQVLQLPVHEQLELVEKIIHNLKTFGIYNPISYKSEENAFWDIIDSLDWNKSNEEAILEPATVKLSKLSEKEIIRFREILAEKLYMLDSLSIAKNIGEFSYKNEEDYFSADSFLYARAFIVARGKEFFYKVISNPECTPKDSYLESILYLPNLAQQLKTGKYDFDANTRFCYETYSNKSAWLPLEVKSPLELAIED